MRIRIHPSALRSGEISVPGDKSIAHRWLILSILSRGPSELSGLPHALDVRSTASCLAAIAPSAREALTRWERSTPPHGEVRGFTWDGPSGESEISLLRVEGEGWDSLSAPVPALDCGNSGTTMRLLMGVVAAAAISARMVGDESLSARPMERVAEPLRRMGADIETSGGTSPVEVRGGELHGIEETLGVASSQVKSAILLAGLRASGTTSVRQPSQTRDHTERALRHLGAAVVIEPGIVTVAPSELPGLRGTTPGDLSSAAFPLVAAALSGSELVIRGVGLNPTRTAFLDVLRRAGLRIEARITSEEVAEPVGEIALAARTGDLLPLIVDADEFPLVADEIPIIAMLASNAPPGATSRIAGAAELRVKESDRLAGTVEAVRALGGDASTERDDLLVRGGGLTGGSASADGDHRLAMALAIGATAATGESLIEGMEAAEVSYPGFLATLLKLGAELEPA